MSPGEVLWRHRVDPDGLVNVRWSTDNGDSWERATVKVKTSRGKLTITELRLPDPTTTSLRRLRFGALEQYLRQRLTPAAADATQGGNVYVKGGSARARATGHGRVILSRPETPRLGAPFYEKFAVAYRDAVARGLSPRPTLAADAGVSRAAIARWAKEAVRRGYLTSVGQGKASI